MSRARPIEHLFGELIELKTPEERELYVQRACGNDQSLRKQLEQLFAAHERAGSFLRECDEGDATVDPEQGDQSGTTIGPYKLREKIAEGGMGTVYVAEQEQPLRRKVALKLIKPGMDSKTVIARFEMERNALALMSHANIAKVLDAGTTDRARPYFVMELVSGIPITDYCDEHKLTIRERLSLFRTVCQAIQHAHQKGIIHRDIKPTNVLVTEQDGESIPKVIDFGVAKAINQRLTDRTVYTSFQSIIGTPLYMSPEQAALSNVDVDTRADIYSLGVLLYELLTGTTPFDEDTLGRAAQDEVLRMIREEEPPKPSTRIASNGAKTPCISSNRRIDHRKLGKLICGDLDWMVMMALEKDRSRRYRTADAFAQDVWKYLHGEPIEARPPSPTYRLQRFVRRHQAAVATGCLITCLIFVSCTIAFFGWASAIAREKELQEALSAKEQTLQKLAVASYGEAVLAALAGDEPKALAALRIADENGISKVKSEVVEGLLAINDGRNDDAIAHAERSLADPTLSLDSDRIAVHSLLVAACCYAGYDDRSFQQLSELLQFQPKEELDFLFMAYANLVNDPRQSLRLLDQVPAIQGSPVGLHLRSICRIMLGSERQDAALLDNALRDCEYVQLLFCGNQCSLAYHLLALTNAITLARSEDRSEDAERYTETGRSVAERLALCDGFPGGDYDMWLFYRAIGDEGRAHQALSRVGKHPGTYSFFGR